MSTVWDRTAEFLSDHLVALTPLVLLGLFAPLTLLGSLMPLIGSSGAAGDMTLGIVALLLSLATSWAGLAITALVFDPSGGRGAAIRVANHRFLPVLGVSLVILLGLVLLALPIVVVLALSGTDITLLASGKLQLTGVNGGAAVFSTFYALVLFPVLFWAYARCVVLITPIMVIERRGLGVFARNFVLTRHIAWKVIGVLLLYGVVSWVASTAVKTVCGTVFALLIGGEGPITLAGVLTQIGVAGISTIFSVLAVVFLAKLYLATRDTPEAIVTVS